MMRLKEWLKKPDEEDPKLQWFESNRMVTEPLIEQEQNENNQDASPNQNADNIQSQENTQEANAN